MGLWMPWGIDAVEGYEDDACVEGLGCVLGQGCHGGCDDDDAGGGHGEGKQIRYAAVELHSLLWECMIDCFGAAVEMMMMLVEVTVRESRFGMRPWSCIRCFGSA